MTRDNCRLVHTSESDMTADHQPTSATATPAALDLLATWLTRQVPAAAGEWLTQSRARLAAQPTERDLQIAFGMVPRKLGRADLALAGPDLTAAAAARHGWDPSGWSVDIAGRVLLLATAASRLDDFADRFSQLCRYGDVAEQIACYSALPLLPDPATLEAQVGEGLRTHMRAVFEAIAHRNPYPAEQFDEHRWNHMVLKALFIGSTLDPIDGLDRRANPELARILRDYAHERWAAHRPVTPELWRCVGRFADADALGDLARAAASNHASERKGAALALAASPAPGAKPLLARLVADADAIQAGRLTWSTLAAEL